jgi:integrase/recombinase XerC/integrase/recombinase XerD
MARHTDPKTTLVYFHNLERIEAGAEKFIDF